MNKHPHKILNIPQASWGREIASVIDTEIIGIPLLAYDEVGSTNDLAKELALNNAPEGLTIIAGCQKQGRGRQGRVWESPKDLGVYLSIVFRPKWKAKDTGWLSILAGVAVADALEDLGLEEVALKWPNDVLVNDKKIAGVLVEPRLGGDRIEFAIMGIGINVQQEASAFVGELEGKATSCRIEGMQVMCRDVEIAVLQKLDRWYRDLSGTRRLELLQDWVDRGGSEQVPEIQEFI